MNDLLAFAIEAHGGLERWNQFRRLTAEVAIGGAIWQVKEVPGMLARVTFEIDTREERLTIAPFQAPGRRALFVPERVWIEKADGTRLASRDNPEAFYSGHTVATPWDALNVIHFAGKAMWTYLMSPFLYTWPGFETEEIAPWQEDGEVWRRLKVTFPDSVASHTKTQITHFGPDGLMRRHDYTVDILGGAPGANYVSGYREVQGIRMPTRRRVYAYDEAMRKVPEPLLVSIDFGRLTFD
ncbi:hypothetical protein [Paraburkholderia sp. J12]|uniref:hypothetical protein n=1 Tax=Paraburkholderia sp. J12 TaxID=2805432 RepID=UPI002ABE7795|nr:hypothetical protein [Paraburkholderia sp. J12]